MQTFTTRPEITGTFGVVTSTHWIASAVGMGVLERGGNAFDAAVAAGFTLQVVEPHLNGPGGDVPILLQRAGDERPQVLCGQGVAPAAATIGHYRSLGLTLVPGTGFLAAVVPGAFGAWLTLLRDHGTIRLADAMAPAIAYARDGCPLVPNAIGTIAAVRSLFVDEWPSSARTWLPGGDLPDPDRPFANPVLAGCYQRIVDDASGAGSREAEIDAAIALFYNGFVAEAIDGFARTPHLDTSGRRHAGVLRADDMAAWRPAYEAPVSLTYGDTEVFKCGPWSQGPVFLQQLSLLAGFDIAGTDPLGADFVHTVIECAKLAFADREAWYGDPDFVDVPLDHLLSAAYAERRRAEVRMDRAGDPAPGTVPGRSARLAGAVDVADAAAAGAGEWTLADYPEEARRSAAGDTCHVDVIDRDGNIVSATPSGGWLQSSPTVPELGFALTTRGQMFWLEEGLAASLAPGKRPRTTLTPSLAHRDGKPWMAFGTPGGDNQDQWTVPFLLRHLHHGMDLQQAIEAPAFHSLHVRSSFYPRDASPQEVAVETRFPEATLAELQRRGHKVSRSGDWALGRISAATRSDDGLLRAAANPRGMQGYAVGR